MDEPRGRSPEERAAYWAKIQSKPSRSLPARINTLADFAAAYARNLLAPATVFAVIFLVAAIEVAANRNEAIEAAAYRQRVAETPWTREPPPARRNGLTSLSYGLLAALAGYWVVRLATRHAAADRARESSKSSA